ncbi:vesicle-associated protein 4-2-like [Cynara cardunculus var. scolymus]|uniref:vesicle-associated protein 4-2-like n=1 Tax=Cynara cardunculus var. scolymus TaxID=59895 RepID=UPI000D62FD71|nr:vesicle-associated protein 4-2-like [Cynara cardunculus var. scolymus]
MAIVDNRPPSEGGGGSKVWGLFKLPFRNTGNVTTHTTTSSSSYQIEGSNAHNSNNHHGSSSSSSVSSVARSLLPTRRRLRLDPRNKLYFPNEPGKQVQSAIKIKNTSKSHVAFKFQTTAPKSCFMRPPGAILAPGESIIATVFKFVEPLDSNEKQMDQKRKVKFKIMSLKVKGMMDYVPELFDEQKDQVAVEQILQVVFLDVERPSPALEKLKHRLAEAEAALESHKKPAEETGPKIINEGLVIDEWKERRERYLARQQVESVDSV